MDIFMIWRREDGVIWLHNAWDGDTISENREGYEADVARAEREGETRVLKASVDFDAVRAAFDIPSLALRLGATEGSDAS